MERAMMPDLICEIASKMNAADPKPMTMESITSTATIHPDGTIEYSSMGKPITRERYAEINPAGDLLFTDLMIAVSTEEIKPMDPLIKGLIEDSAELLYRSIMDAL